MKRILIGLAVFAVVTIGVAANTPPTIARHIVMSSVSFEYTLDDLTDAADAIAVVRATGKDNAHWNNAANTAWISDGPAAAMIYNDQEVVVVNVIRGQLARRLTLRNVGGVVGDTRFELEGLAPLRPGVDYLVFLETFDTPTQEGTESALSFLGQEQGVFPADGTSFASNHGLRATTDQLQP